MAFGLPGPLLALTLPPLRQVISQDAGARRGVVQRGVVRVVVALFAAMTVLVGCGDWLQFGGDQTHANVAMGSSITPQNVGQLHQVWQVPTPTGEWVNSQALEANGVATPSGTRSLLVMSGNQGGLFALDAGTGQTVWQVPRPSPNTCFVPDSSGEQCILQGSPAIDTDSQLVYHYVPETGQVHRYALGTGQEVPGGGWPETVTLKPNLEKVSSSLTIAKFGPAKYLYVTTAGFDGDFGDYQGHVTTINLADGSQHVFNALCSNQPVYLLVAPNQPSCPESDAGIWSRSGVIPDTDTGKVYAATGNGTFDPTNHDWGDTVFALNPDGTGNANGDPIDSWTPSNYAQLQAADQDLGSAEPTLLPHMPGSRFQHLGLQAGKSGSLYFLNLDDLSGQGGPGHVGGEVPWSPAPVPQGGGVYGQPIVWTDPQGRVWVLITNVAGMSGSLVLTDPVGNPYLSTQWVTTGGSEVIAPVTKGGVFFTVVNHAIIADDATTGQPLWFSGLPGNIHMQMPLVTANSVYITDLNSTVTAFSL